MKTPCLCTGRRDIVCNEKHCDIAGPGSPGDPNSCRICWNRLGRNAALAFTPRPCVHLGGPTGETALCNTCAGRVQIKLHHCAIHGQCSPKKKLPDTACCRCRQYVAPVFPSTRRNLLFHIYPANNRGVWQRWVLHLLKRMRLFNGKRCVAIVTGPGLDPPEKVQEAFRGTIDEWIVTPNNPELREAKTLMPLLRLVRSDAANEVTFWGHCKGTTQLVNAGVMSHVWGRVMLETCLDYWPLAEQLLQDFPTVGSFKKTGWSWGLSSWHFSGSFFWFRNAELFRRAWTRMDATWWGIETYPGAQFKESESACLFHEGRAWDMNLYERSYWVSRVLPAWKKWKEDHAQHATEWDRFPERLVTA